MKFYQELPKKDLTLETHGDIFEIFNNKLLIYNNQQRLARTHKPKNVNFRHSINFMFPPCRWYNNQVIKQLA